MFPRIAALFLSQKLLELLQVANFVGRLDGAGLSLGVEVYLVNVRSLGPQNIGIWVVAYHQAGTWCRIELLEGIVKDAGIGLFVACSLGGHDQFEVVRKSGGAHFFCLRLIKAVGNEVDAVAFSEVV